MNELIAIIIIVLICCAMFFAWLISMGKLIEPLKLLLAACPDQMVDFIGGNTNPNCSSASSMSSKDLLSNKSLLNSPTVETKTLLDAKKHPSVDLQKSRTNSKKLSVVPEQDEQVLN